MKIYMLSKYLKKAAAVMSSVMIFSFAIQAVSPSFVAKADSVSTQTTASAGSTGKTAYIKSFGIIWKERGKSFGRCVYI